MSVQDWITLALGLATTSLSAFTLGWSVGRRPWREVQHQISLLERLATDALQASREAAAEERGHSDQGYHGPKGQ